MAGKSRSTMMFVFSVAALTMLFLAVWGGSAYFLTTKQNELAQSGARTMMQSGFSNAVDTSVGFTVGYSLWDTAYYNVRLRNTHWAYANIGMAVETGVFDLVAFWYDDGTQISWSEAGEDKVRTDFIAPEIHRLLADGKAALPFNKPVHGFVWIDDTLWLLTAMHLQPFTGLLTDLERATAPLAIYGKRFDAATIEGIATEFLLDGAALERDPARFDPAHDIAVRGFDGSPVASISWTRPMPGTAILRAWAVPAGALVVLALFVSGAIGRFIVIMAARLRESMVRAQATDRAKSVLLANVSHELRTPMNGILGAAQILQDSELNADDREMIDIIESSAQDQLELIEDLIQVARVDSGDLSVRRQSVSLDDLFAKVVSGLQLAAAQKGLSLTSDVAPDVPSVMVDPRLLRQSIVNLVGNAIKFTPDGHVGLTADWEPRADRAGRLKIAVSDTGIGIDPAQHDRVFDRFSQADDGIQRVYGGTGLGLSITRSLIQGMGGTISLSSQPGEGSCFAIDLPCEIGSAPAVQSGALAA